MQPKRFRGNKKQQPTSDDDNQTSFKVIPAIYKKLNEFIHEYKKNEGYKQQNKNNDKAPQPFIVKVEESKKWSRQEKIAVAGTVVSFLGILVAVLAIRQANTSINETKKQFATINMPYLQVDSTEVFYDEHQPKIYLVLYLANVGQYPAKIINYKRHLSLGYMENPLDSMINDTEIDTIKVVTPIGMYVAKEFPRRLADTLNFGMYWYQQIRSGQKSIYVHGKVLYQNLGNNSNRLYEFGIKLTQTPVSIAREVYINDNSDTK